MSSVPVMSYTTKFCSWEPAILYLLRGGLEDYWGTTCFSEGDGREESVVVAEY